MTIERFSVLHKGRFKLGHSPVFTPERLDRVYQINLDKNTIIVDGIAHQIRFPSMFVEASEGCSLNNQPDLTVIQLPQGGFRVSLGYPENLVIMGDVRQKVAR